MPEALSQNSHSRKPLNFSHFLSPADWKSLGSPEKWRWISSLGFHPVRAIRHPAHEAWIRIKGNVHRPAHREVMLTLRGQAVFSIDGRCFLRRPGTVILLERNQLRDLKGAPTKRSFSCLWLHLHSPDYLTYYVNTCDQRGYHTHQIPMQTLPGSAARLISDAWDHCQHAPEDPIAAAFLKSTITTTILECLGRTPDPRLPDSHHRQIIESVKAYIQRHPGSELDLQNLARIAGYSPFFFHRLFQRHAGQTPAQYVHAVRLEHATQLLDQNHTIEAVAEAVGFASVSHFHQFFKKHFKHSPGAWKRSQTIQIAPPPQPNPTRSSSS